MRKSLYMKFRAMQTKYRDFFENCCQRCRLPGKRARAKGVSACAPAAALGAKRGFLSRATLKKRCNRHGRRTTGIKDRGVKMSFLPAATQKAPAPSKIGQVCAKLRASSRKDRAQGAVRPSTCVEVMRSCRHFADRAAPCGIVTKSFPAPGAPSRPGAIFAQRR